MTKTLSWGVKPPDQVKQGLVIEPAPTVELRTGPDQVLDLGQGRVTIRREDGGPLVGTTSQPLINGVATFDDLVIPEPGLHELVAEVDAESLVYPGPSSEGAVVFFRFDQPPGTTEVEAEAGGVTLEIPPEWELTGRFLRRVTTGGPVLTVMTSEIPGLYDLFDSRGTMAVFRIWYRRPLGTGAEMMVGFRHSLSSNYWAFQLAVRGTTSDETSEDAYRSDIATNSFPLSRTPFAPSGVPHLISFSWRVEGSGTQRSYPMDFYVDGSYVSSSSRSGPSSQARPNYLHMQSFTGGEIYAIGIFEVETSPEQEMAEALRCGVVR